MEMQEKGITNPSQEIKNFTKNFVTRLKEFPLDEEIELRVTSFYDSKGNFIMEIPID
jgi:hypothetical protein